MILFEDLSDALCELRYVALYVGCYLLEHCGQLNCILFLGNLLMMLFHAEIFQCVLHKGVYMYIHVTILGSMECVTSD